MIRKLALIALALGLAAACSQEKKKSIEKTNEGVKMLRSKHYADAVAKFEDATKAYAENHTAWYNLGLAYDGQKKWDDAARAYEKAASLSSGDAMYHMHLGIARYKGTLAEATARQAKAMGKDPSELDPRDLDLKGANFDPALQALEAAIKINGDLFRAHYYIGRIHRHNDDAKRAADAFTRAIEANPRFGDPYIALGELYRQWDYTDEAIKVLTQGKANVPGDKERSELLFALGMAYDDKKDYQRAVEEFTAAIDADRNLARAKFQRGMAYLRINELKKAKADLEDFQKSARDDFLKGLAGKALMDIMAKSL